MPSTAPANWNSPLSAGNTPGDRVATYRPRAPPAPPPRATATPCSSANSGAPTAARQPAPRPPPGAARATATPRRAPAAPGASDTAAGARPRRIESARQPGSRPPGLPGARPARAAPRTLPPCGPDRHRLPAQTPRSPRWRASRGGQCRWCLRPLSRSCRSLSHRVTGAATAAGPIRRPPQSRRRCAPRYSPPRGPGPLRPSQRARPAHAPPAP